MKVALALGVLSALCCNAAKAATASYEYDWRTLDYDQFTSNRPKRFDGTMFGTNTSDSYKCIHFDCLARNSNQDLYSQYSGDSWTRRCMLPVNDTTYLQPCNNATDRCLYLEGSQDAICVNFYEINNITELMPGDSCPVEWYDRKREKCQWGTFKCISGVCEGFKEGEYCSRQLDCVPGTYCFQNNTCVAEKKAGDPCVANYECARNAQCVLNQDRTNSSCVEYFSLKVGDSAAPNFAGSSVIAEELTEMLCQSGTLHPTTGKCIEAPKSTNLGKKCDSDTDCGTSTPGLYAKCQCYMGRANSKKCGPVRGDPEGEVADATVTLCFRKERIHQFFASLHDLVQFSCDSQPQNHPTKSESGKFEKSDRGSPSQDDICLKKLVQDTKQSVSPSSKKKPKDSYQDEEKENLPEGNRRPGSRTSSKEIFDLSQNSVSDLLNAKLAATKKFARKPSPPPVLQQDSIEEQQVEPEMMKSRFCLHFFQQRSNKLHLILQQADGGFFKEQIELGDFIIPRYHKSLMTKEGVVILTGGFINDQPSKKTFLVDIETQIMVETSEMNVGRTGHILLSHGGLIYAIGGVTEEEKVTDTCEVFSPQLNTWNEIARLNHGCHSACAISMNGAIYKYGGKNDEGEVCQVIEKFTGREWVEIKFDSHKFMMFSSSLAFQINSQEMIIVGGTAGDYQEKSGETFIVSIPSNPRDHKVSIRSGPALPSKEGFWTQDVEFQDGSAFILQNISDHRDRRNVHLDERRLIQLDLNSLSWSILPVNN